MDGLTLMNVWTVLFRFSGLLKTHQKRTRNWERILRVRSWVWEKLGERWGEYDQNICMYEISKELIKYLF